MIDKLKGESGLVTEKDGLRNEQRGDEQKEPGRKYTRTGITLLDSYNLKTSKLVHFDKPPSRLIYTNNFYDSWL